MQLDVREPVVLAVDHLGTPVAGVEGSFVGAEDFVSADFVQVMAESSRTHH